MRTKTRVGAIIVNDGKLLLIHRRKHGDEYWVLVGGGVEEGETAEEALRREVKEETSLDVLGDEKWKEVEIDSTLHVLYECRTAGGEPELGGPEKQANNEDNWFNPEWVDIRMVAKIEDIYPVIIRQWADERLKTTV